MHHSDRGVQYTCGAYRALLEEHGIRGSMRRCGNPYDNAHAESLMKTLKCEEVYRNEYAELDEAASLSIRFITSNACTRCWVIVRPANSSNGNGGPARPGEQRYEFSEA